MSWELLNLVDSSTKHYQWNYSDAAVSIGTIGGRSLSDFFLIKVEKYVLDPSINNTFRAWLGSYIQICEFYPSVSPSTGLAEGDSVFYFPAPPVQEVMIGPTKQGLTFTGGMPLARELRIPYNVKPGSPLQGRFIGVRILPKSQKKNFTGYTETNILNTAEKTFKGRIGYKSPYDDRLEFKVFHWCEPLTLAARVSTADLTSLQEAIYDVLSNVPQSLQEIVTVYKNNGGPAPVRDITATLRELADLGLARKVDDESGVYWARDV